MKELEEKYKKAIEALKLLEKISGYHDGFECSCWSNDPKCDRCIALDAMEEVLNEK